MTLGKLAVPNENDLGDVDDVVIDMWQTTDVVNNSKGSQLRYKRFIFDSLCTSKNL